MDGRDAVDVVESGNRDMFGFAIETKDTHPGDRVPPEKVVLNGRGIVAPGSDACDIVGDTAWTIYGTKTRRRQKRMQSFEIPQEAFLAVLKVNES